MTLYIKRLKLMRAAARVQRCHTTPSIYRQSVGEHTFGLLAILNEIYSGTLEDHARLMIAVLQHDVAETITGDAPAPAKWMYPELEGALRIAEEGVRIDYGLGMSLTDHEKRVLKFCDFMELSIFAMEEYDMGNRHMQVMCGNALRAIETRKLHKVTEAADDLYQIMMNEAFSRWGTHLPDVADTWHGIPLVVQNYRSENDGK